MQKQVTQEPRGFTRASINRLQGTDENDLLNDSPIFDKDEQVFGQADFDTLNI